MSKTGIKADLKHEIAVLELVLRRGVDMSAWPDATDDHAAIRRTIARLKEELGEESSMPPDHQIKQMVDRFLGWRLPDDFDPDCGISFSKQYAGGTCYPTGTNLFSATQAEAMIRFMFERDEAEPEAPAEIRDLLLDETVENGFFRPDVVNRRMVECFQRGRVSERDGLSPLSREHGPAGRGKR